MGRITLELRADVVPKTAGETATQRIIIFPHLVSRCLVLGVQVGL